MLVHINLQYTVNDFCINYRGFVNACYQFNYVFIQTNQLSNYILMSIFIIFCIRSSTVCSLIDGRNHTNSIVVTVFFGNSFDSLPSSSTGTAIFCNISSIYTFPALCYFYFLTHFLISCCFIISIIGSM